MRAHAFRSLARLRSPRESPRLVTVLSASRARLHILAFRTNVAGHATGTGSTIQADRVGVAFEFLPAARRHHLCCTSHAFNELRATDKNGGRRHERKARASFLPELTLATA